MVARYLVSHEPSDGLLTKPPGSIGARAAMATRTVVIQHAQLTCYYSVGCPHLLFDMCVMNTRTASGDGGQG